VVAVVDGRRIGQALVNLGLNAIQTIESAQRTGTVRLALTCDGARREARFTVHDDGPGIPAALRDAVLDPFVSTRCDGTGLGLPQAKRAAERHGGRLELADADGGGLIATLVLPLGESGQCAS
jgi:two-component system nitrogen regulation sensor histidine kinase NtrY